MQIAVERPTNVQTVDIFTVFPGGSLYKDVQGPGNTGPWYHQLLPGSWAAALKAYWVQPVPQPSPAIDGDLVFVGLDKAQRVPWQISWDHTTNTWSQPVRL